MPIATIGRSALTALMLITAVGCASLVDDGPEPAPAAAPALDPALVPPPPESAEPEVASSWEALRRGDTTAPVPGSQSAAARALGGWRALVTGDTEMAAREFGAALDIADLAAAAYGMGLVAERNGEPEVARRWYERAEQIDPGFTRASLQGRRIALENVAGLLLQAERAVAQGDLVAAAEAYRQVTERAPELPGSYLALSRLQRRQEDPEAAMRVLEEGLRRAGDRPALLESLADLYREAERYREAADVYARLAALVPDDPRVARLARETRREYELAALPPEYRRLVDKEVISRADLAALLAIELDFLEDVVPRQDGVIIADGGDSWAAPHIRRVVEWGLLDVYQNGAFLPEMEVRRSMLVEAAYEVLDLLGIADRAPRPSIQDPPPAHVLYRPVQAVVGYDLLPTVEAGSVDLLGTVSGAEATEVAGRLARLAREHGGEH